MFKSDNYRTIVVAKSILNLYNNYKYVEIKKRLWNYAEFTESVTILLQFG